jgi:hypothetical protein
MRIFIKKEKLQDIPKVGVSSWGFPSIESEWSKNSPHIDIDVDDKTADTVPDEAILYVKYNAVLSDYFRRDGIYHHEGATLKAQSIFVSSSWNEKFPAQSVDITGPNVRSVRLIYSLLRRGHLKPSEDWTADAIRVKDM